MAEPAPQRHRRFAGLASDLIGRQISVYAISETRLATLAVFLLGGRALDGLVGSSNSTGAALIQIDGTTHGNHHARH